jgi:hypothetical protein
LHASKGCVASPPAINKDVGFEVAISMKIGRYLQSTHSKTFSSSLMSMYVQTPLPSFACIASAALFLGEFYPIV